MVIKLAKDNIKSTINLGASDGDFFHWRLLGLVQEVAISTLV